MNKIINKTIWALFFVALLMLGACTDLEEEISGTSDKLTSSSIAGVLNGAYGSLAPILGWNIYFSELACTPEAIMTWHGDPAIAYRHEWDGASVEQTSSCETFRFLGSGISNCNSAMKMIGDNLNTASKTDKPTVEAYLAEAKFMKALYEYWHWELYGQIPYRAIDDYNYYVPCGVMNAKDGYDILVAEITEAIEKLKFKAETPTSSGRANKGAARMLLAQVYMNSSWVTGTPHWAEALQVLNDLINSGEYAVDPDYWNTFSPTNQDNSDIIFGELFRKEPGNPGGMCEPGIFLNGGHWVNPGLYGWGTGACSTQDLVAMFDKINDKRYQSPLDMQAGFSWGILVGPMHSPGSTTDTIKTSDGTPVIYTPTVSSLYFSNFEGPRVLKYSKVGDESGPNIQSNTFAIFRYAQALLQRAECLNRLNQGDKGLADLNYIRTIRGLSALGAMPAGQAGLDSLFIESRRELYMEPNARPDYIRFGKFGGTWCLKPTPDASPLAKRFYNPPPKYAISNPNFIMDPNAQQ
jgi:hypothetical protein